MISSVWVKEMRDYEVRNILVERLKENLREIRRIAGWSGEDLGGMLGLSRQSISKLETGLSSLTVAQYIAVRHLLDAWMKSHPENKTLPRMVTLLLDERRIWGIGYKELQYIAKNIADMVAGGVDQAVVDTVAKTLLDEWEGPAREYCQAQLQKPMVASKIGITADAEPVDWTEIIISGRNKKD